jgi:hypothetical protein
MQRIELIPLGNDFRPPITDSLEDLTHVLKIFVPQEMKVAWEAGARRDFALVVGSLGTFSA